MKEDSSNENEEFDPEGLESFTLPDSFLQRLYEFSGSSSKDRGFLLAYVNQGGQVVVVQKAESQIIDLGLRKGVEKYLIDIEESEGRMDFPGNEE